MVTWTLLMQQESREETQPLLASAMSQHAAGTRGYFLISLTQCLEWIQCVLLFLSAPPNVPIMDSSPGPAPILQFSEERLLSLSSL